jgi:ankyrin repeat protein
MTTLGPESHAAWWIAVEAGHLDRLRALLQEGTDPNLRDRSAETALHRVAGDLENEPAPENLQIARLLLESGAEINAADKDQHTPLMSAAHGGSAEMIALFLQQGADTEARDREGKTALMYALQNAPTVCQLLDHGANLQARDCRGRTALMGAVQHSYHRTVQVLLKRGAEVQVADDQGETALLIAVRQASEQEKTLRTLEADAACEHPKYASAHRLLWLVRKRAEEFLEIVRLLVQHGAK